MPEIGEIKQAKEIGRAGRHKHIYFACEGCGKCRWVELRKGFPKYRLCYNCAMGIQAGEESPSLKGGRRKMKRGYVLIHLQPDSFFFSMADKNGYIWEHRLMMAEKLGMCLPKEARVISFRRLREV